MGTVMKKVENPDQIRSYFKLEYLPLGLVTVSGVFYNIGMVAGPYFEGRLAQCLFDVMGKRKTFSDMLRLVIVYLAVILAVQAMRCVKRYYVRRFANDTSRNMRHMLYNSLVNMERDKLEQENVGSIMTKAISDVDACVEGMRKFTTEIFDTGIVLIAYLVMLFSYDWRLAILASMFTPLAYVIAERLKVRVTRCNVDYKKSAGMLNSATMDRVGNAVTYRIYGCDRNRDQAYEKHLSNYERSAVAANFWESAMQPIYHMISMCGVFFVLYLGGKNVLGTGWTNWNIAAFTTFLSCFGKMALKSSKAAKLFNSVQKAQVSWARIKPLMKPYVEPDTTTDIDLQAPVSLKVLKAGAGWPNGEKVLEGISFSAEEGTMIGVTGAVASGKSMLGRMLLGELPYEGSIQIGERELRTLSLYEKSQLISYLGHEPQLMSVSVAENIRLGIPGDIAECLHMVCLDQEIEDMPMKTETGVGNGGIRLSGGQQARLALARTCFYGKRIWILDDPFSAVDQKTEQIIFEHLREVAKDGILILISHRLRLFPQLDQVLFLENGTAAMAPHQKLMQENASYRNLYEIQNVGGVDDEK